MENVQFNTKNRSGKGNVISLEKGKLPPQALDLEEAVLGAMMIDKEAIDTVIDILHPDVFYKEAHQHIYKAIFTLFQTSQPADLLTVSEQLKKDGNLEAAGGDYYLIHLTQKVASTAHVEYHARIVLEKYIKRSLIRISGKIEEESFDETSDVFDVLDGAEAKLFEISQGNLKKSSEDAQTLVSQAIKHIEEISKKEGMSGVPSGFEKVDAITSGWQNSDLIVIAARPGMGKCLGKGTKVLMYDGTLKKVEDIQVGELIMGNDSTPRTVLSLARGREKMYWVHQNKAISYRVNESHILSLKRSRNEGKHQHGDVLNISIQEYLNKSSKFKSNYKGYKTAVSFDKKEMTLSPYFLGLWLGDGHSYSQRITNIDSEIIQYLNEYAEAHDLEFSEYSQPNRTSSYGMVRKTNSASSQLSIRAELKRLNLIQNKHIPREYLINSIENRLQLLAGLIDTDGYYTDRYNCFEIVQKDEQLSYQIKFLCDTLGFRTSIRKKKTSIKSSGFKGEAFRIRIFGNLDCIPTRIERKKARPWKAKVDWKVTGIKVEYDKVDDYYGFEIDGNHLFLLEDMTVTHNTAYVLSMAKNIGINFNMPVAIFSLEMSSVQLITRMISSETGLTSEKLRKGNLLPHEWEQLNVKVKNLTKAPIYIDDTPSLSIFDLRAKARRLVSQYGVKILIIDYLQLMTGGSAGKGPGNREQEISSISRNLKALAKELNIPVITLSQLSRAVETRGGTKRPLLSDLRESGAIEQDADIVSFIYRPEYYGFTEWDDEERTPCASQAEFIIAKHRNGGLDNVRLKFTGHLAQFSNLEENFGGNYFASKMNDDNIIPDSARQIDPRDAFGEDEVPF